MPTRATVSLQATSCSSVHSRLTNGSSHSSSPAAVAVVSKLAWLGFSRAEALVVMSVVGRVGAARGYRNAGALQMAGSWSL
mmetsp:Transcript_20922/g.62428  ORF Transcript_20922/g.62428 Transcript_20922/m.62428 type:complete len:81 (+) Transcript_20922:110-352(+)